MYAFGDSITFGRDASDEATLGYVPLLAAALGVGFVNRAVPGTGMISPGGILDQMLSVPVPTRYEVCVTIVGVNDMYGAGDNPTHLGLVKAGLRDGLLHLTSRRRVPPPTSPQEAQLLSQGRLPSRPAGCSVWVGTTLKQSEGYYGGLGSPEIQALYAAAIAEVVASVAAQGRRVYLVDTGSAYDPDTMGSAATAPSHIHPSDAGHLVLANTFLAAMQGVAA